MKPKIHKGPLVVVVIIIVLAFLGGQTAQAQSQTPARQEEAVQAQLKTKLLKKQHKSKTVINWWNNRGKPALGLKHEKCSELTGIKRQRDVLNRTGQRSDLVERIGDGEYPAHRQKFVGGLETNAAADAARISDRAGRVRAQCNRCKAGADGGAGTRRRPRIRRSAISIQAASTPG